MCHDEQVHHQGYQNKCGEEDLARTCPTFNGFHDQGYNLFLIFPFVSVADQIIGISEIFWTENVKTTGVPNDKVDVGRYKDYHDFDKRSNKVMVHLRELMWKEKPRKPCNGKEQGAN